ncbi:hypothetical protein [Halorubrum tibetense]|uniref:Uncharacterized protein n=1 Tax=Halorubrum tibetense TaxID=175631 RepID=A0ABD5SBP6_9EURY
MSSPNGSPSRNGALETIYKRYGPGRFTAAGSPALGAGYAAVIAALAAALLYAGTTVAADWIGVGSEPAVMAAFALLVLPFVLPAAFLVGVVGWRLLPSRRPVAGAVAGIFGTIATYLLTLFGFGSVVVGAAVLSLSGATPLSAAAFSWGVIFIAFTLTWWITVPLGCLVGWRYASAVRGSDHSGDGSGGVPL